MNKEDAKKLKLRDGQVAKISSRRGDILATIEDGGLPAGGACRSPCRRVRPGQKVADSRPLSKETDYKKCAVKVRRLR